MESKKFQGKIDITIAVISNLGNDFKIQFQDDG